MSYILHKIYMWTKLKHGKRLFGESRGGFAARRFVIQAADVDQTEPWPDGQDRREDQALPA